MVTTIRNQMYSQIKSINHSFVLTFTFHISFKPHHSLCPTAAHHVYQCDNSHFY